MFIRRGFASLLLTALFSLTHASGEDIKESPLKNANLEEGELGKAPIGWMIPGVCTKDGYALTLSDVQPFMGKYCAILSRDSKSKPEAFGNVIQSINAVSFRGKRIRFKAAVRADVPGDNCQAMLWLRVDRDSGEMGFFDNMADRPIRENKWKEYEIVGDVADNASTITLGVMLIGNGKAALDNASLEIVDQTIKQTGQANQPKPTPGLMQLSMEAGFTATGETPATTLLFPLPLAYRDQVPLTFDFTVDPPTAAKAIEISDGAGENRVLKLQLHNLDNEHKVRIHYHSLMLVTPTNFAAVPKFAAFPKEWPAEAQPWLASTWSVDHENERVKKLALEIRGDSNDVLAVITRTLARAKDVFAQTKGRVNDLTSVEALEKSGSCTSCANLVAALLRGAGIPARVLAGYPLWSGPLQTHYIVEAYVPSYGWYPVESTMCQAPWPNHQQVNVSIVPVEYERQDKAGRRTFAAGAVPYLSLTECTDPAAKIYVIGTLKPYCDHECKMVRALSEKEADWTNALQWAKPRWSAWVKSQPTLAGGKLTFGPMADSVKAKTLLELQRELK